jgi:hypothetical protein
MMALPPEQRQIAQALLAQRAAAEGAKKEKGGQFWQAFGRGTSGLVVGTSRTWEMDTLDDAEQKLNAMKPGEEFGGRFGSLYKAARGKSADGLEMRTLGFILEPLLKNQVATAESIAEAKAKITTERERLVVGMQLEQIGKGALDPIKGSGFMTEKIWYPFAESILPQIALAMATRRIAPVGSGLTGALASSAGAMVPMFGMMADQNAQQLMQQNPEMDVGTAFRLGRNASYLQTGLEYAQLMIGMGTVPKLGQALRTMQAGALKTAGKALGVGLVAQNTIEAAQDILPPIVQALSEDVVNVDWARVMQGELQPDGITRVGGYWAQRVDTALALLPMVVFGTGGKVMQARAGAVQLQQVAASMTDTNLHAAGLAPEVRAAILAETDAVARLDAFSAALPAADAATATEGAARMAAERKARKQAFEASLASAGITFDQSMLDGKPVYRVTKGDVTTEHGDEGSAYRAALDHLGAADAAAHQDILEMMQVMMNRPASPLKGGAQVDLNQPKPTVLQFIADRFNESQDMSLPEPQRQWAQKQQDAMMDRWEIFLAENPGTLLTQSDVTVDGQSGIQKVKEGVYKAVIKLSNGIEAAVVFEEFVEADFGAFVALGQATQARMIAAINEVQGLTGDTYLNGHTGGMDVEKDLLALKEAYSKLAHIFVIGQSRAGQQDMTDVAALTRNNRRKDAKGMRQRLVEAMNSGAVDKTLVDRLKDAMAWMKFTIGQAIRLNKARRESGGKLAIDEFLNKSIGMEADAQHAQGVIEEANRILPAEETSGPGFSVKQRMDAEYMAAVEAGDVEKQQAMVDKAAKAAGYNVGPVWHAMGADFSTFEPNRIAFGIHLGTENQAGKAYQRKALIMDKGSRIGKFYAAIENPLSMPDGNWENPQAVTDRLRKAGVFGPDVDPSFQQSTNDLFALGFDGIVYNNEAEGAGKSFIALFPDQIKSADPVTRDKSGNVIPLSERFNPAKDSISFSITTADRLSAADIAIKNRMNDILLNRIAAGDEFSALKKRILDVLKPKKGDFFPRETAAKRAILKDRLDRLENGIRDGVITKAQFGTLFQVDYLRVVDWEQQEKDAVFSVLNPFIDSLKFEGKTLPRPTVYGRVSWESFQQNQIEGRGGESSSLSFSLQSRAQPADAARRTVMPDGAELIGPTSFSIRAYHGTPHKVDEFSLDKIGTGQGAQVYGWGLYFAESEGVAKQYQKDLSLSIEIDGRKILDNNTRTRRFQDYGTDEAQAETILISERGDLEKAIKKAQSNGAFKRSIPILEQMRGKVKAHAEGNLYAVDLLPDEADFLDWDKPLSEQSEKVQAALGPIKALLNEERGPGSKNPDLTFYGSSIYGWFAKVRGGDAKGSSYLASIGIPGIKYLDGNSRADGEGSRNYVIFDDKLIKILEENGQPVDEANTEKSVADPDAPSFALKPFTPVASAFYSKKLAAWEAGEDIGRGEISLGATPPVLRVAGADRRGMMIEPGLFAKVTSGKHAVPIEALRSLPQALADPIAVFRSRSDGDSMVVLTEFTEPGKGSVVAVVHLSTTADARTVVNRIASLYGRSNENILTMFQDGPLYVNTQKSRNWLRTAGLQLPGARGFQSGSGNVPTETDVVKFAEEQGGTPSFRLTPIATLDRLAADIERRKRDPEMRRKIYDSMKAALNSLRTRWSEVQQRWNGESPPVIEQKSKKELDKEQAFREALAYADAEETIYNTLTPEAQAALGMTGEDTSAYAGALAQRFSGGRFGNRGRITGRGEARKQASQAGTAMGGEYDGAEGLPAMFFGGSLSVDEAAQEAFEAGEISDATPDALWDAMRSELQTQASNKDAMKSALATLKESHKQARNKAREEAAGWRTQQDEMQAKDWDARAVMLRHLRTLDALLSALPAEVRAKVGGWTAIASLQTQAAMQKELEHRLKVADEYLEKALKKDALASIAALIEKAKPTREAGKKPKGKLGAAVHRFFDEAARVMGMTAEEVTGEQAKLENMMADATTDEARADIFERQQVLDTYGDLKNQDAAHITRALDKLEHVYTTGRNMWRMIEEARLAEVKAMAETLIGTWGEGTEARLQAQAAIANRLRERVRNGATWDMYSASQIFDDLLGDAHPLAIRWKRMLREGSIATQDNQRALNRRWQDAMKKAFGGYGLKARKLLWKMAMDNTVKMEVTPVSITEIRIPIDSMPNMAALGYSKADIEAAKEAFDALPEDSKAEHVTIPRVAKGSTELVNYSEAQALAITMLADQEQYSANLQRVGWTQEAVAQLESMLSEPAKVLRDFMRAEYQDGYTPINQVFERMFGVSLPQIKGYSPANFWHTGQERASGPEGDVQNTGFRATALKSRTKHMAKPKAKNAFALFFGHHAQMSHWQNNAEFARELRGVFGNPEVKGSLTSRFGEGAMRAVMQRIESIEGNGIMQAYGEMDSVFSMVARWKAYSALAWNMGTAMVQATAATGVAMKMPPAAYMRGLGKILTGRGWGTIHKMWNSETIRRRMEAMWGREVTDSLGQTIAGPTFLQGPGRFGEFANLGMDFIGNVDAAFTSIGGAIHFEWAEREALKAGLSPEDALRHAEEETSQIIFETAQPQTAAQKSNFELRNAGLAKVAYMFMSDARKNTAHFIKLVAGANDRNRAKALLLWPVLGVLTQAIRNVWQDAKDDDDDELFDPINWTGKEFLFAALMGPTNGIPVLGESLNKMATGYGSSGVADNTVRAVAKVADLMETTDEEKRDKERIETTTRDALTVIKGLNVALSVPANVAEQAFRTLDNATDSAEEITIKIDRLKRSRQKEKDPEQRAALEERIDALQTKLP